MEENENLVNKPMLAVCEICKNPIYEKDDLIIKHVGRHHTQYVCSTCENARIAREKRNEKENNIKYRLHSFIFGGIVAAILIAIFVYSGISAGDNSYIGYGIAFGIFGFTFVSCMILRNNFIADLWFEVFSWGFKTMPRIIFELSFDGIAFLIACKILFFILSIALACCTGILATIIATLLSIFVYPYAIIKINKDIKKN